MTRDEIIDRARSVKGRKFHPRGRSEHGMDCVGHIRISYGLEADHLDYAPEKATDGQLKEHLLAAGFEVVRIADAQPGDLVSFRWWGKGDAVERHAGVLVEPDRIVHACDGAAGKVQEVPFSASRRRLAVRAYRLKGIE